MKRMRKKVLLMSAACLTLALLPLRRQEKVWTLTDCIDYALNENIQVRKADVSLNVGEISLQQARDNRWPSVSASLSSVVTLFSGFQTQNEIRQAELMKIYRKFFEGFDQKVAQVLLTKDVVTIPSRNMNARRTLMRLLEMNIIPVINENDTIATCEIVFGDNDTLSAIVAALTGADLLVMLSDIDGLYDADPRNDNSARMIHSVSGITPELEKLASGTASVLGTGGMVTKISAAKMCLDNGIDCVITNGSDPTVIFDILGGEIRGTHFTASASKVKQFV
jgi:glutamate 5-kinase